MRLHRLAKVVFISCLVSLVGCGGGGGSSSGPESTATHAAQPSSEAQAINEEQTANEEQLLGEAVKSGTAVISVPAGFNFSTSYTVAVDVDISNRTTDRAYLSLCDDYTQLEDDSFVVNYENCSIRTALESGVYESSLTLANNTSQMLSIIWFYTGETPEIIEHVALNPSNANIVIR